MSDIHVSRDGAQFGPYDEVLAQSLFAQGRIVGTDLVWREGMAQWLTAAEVLPPVVPVAPPVAQMPPMPPMTADRPMGHAPLHSSMQPDMSLRIPLPPKLHWGLVMLFGVLTMGIFVYVWVILQANWAKKIDRSSNAPVLMWLYVVAAVLYWIFAVMASVGGMGSLNGGHAQIMLVFQVAALVVFCFGIYSIRRSMLDYYNQVEPISLRMSGAMTFFFNVLYLQHHMTRIANWKISGNLPPQ
jgi:hypothetical protein